MEFRVLGPLEVTDDDEPIALGGHKQRIVLSLLLLHANEVVSADALIDAVWADGASQRARATLQVYIANLRRIIDTDPGRPRLIRQTPGYLLRTIDHELDLDRYRRLIEESRVAMSLRDPMRASLLLRAALTLWRGPAFPDLLEVGVSTAELAALEEDRLNALEDRIDADLEAGRAGQVVTELASLVGMHPLRERLHAQRMLALYRANRQADALAAYRSARASLRDQLGVDPGAELQAMEHAVLHHDSKLDTPAAPSRVRASLPVATTELIGRERELVALTALLSEAPVRLVTLLGPGGTGKSRLGLELATTAQDNFPDGVFYVSLAPLTNPSFVIPAIASALRLRESAARPLHEILVHRLSVDHCLLVLDNFEQLLPAATDVAELLSGTQHLKILVTSRAPLRIHGEHEYPVDPLTLPSVDPMPPPDEIHKSAAVRLFLERARAITPSFALSDQDAAAVAAICHRLDGLPLAIELAAARTRVLSPQAILTRLDARLRLLTGGPRDVPTQQQTLRGSIEWSYELLVAEERDLFARLAVFRGGCVLDAVEVVCTPEGGDPLDVMDRVDSLVSQNLLQRRRAAHGASRLVMLQTIHEFAEELLDHWPDDSVRRRHAEYFAELAETAEPWLTGGRQLEGLTRLSSEHDNLRAALAWSSHRNVDAPIALRLAAALWHFWEMSGSFTEGRRWLEAVIARGDVSVPALRLRAITGAATMAWSVGDHDRATQLHEEALDLAKRVGDAAAEAFSLNALGAQLIDTEHYVAAKDMFDQARTLAMEVDESRTAGMATHNIAEIEFYRGRFAEAVTGYQEALQIFRELDDQWAVACTLHGLALAVLRQGDREQAAQALRDGLRLAIEVGENYSLADSLEGLAVVAEDSEQPVRAVRLLAAADAIRHRISAPLQISYRGDHESLLDALHGQLSDEAFGHAWEVGHRFNLAQSFEEASQV